MIQRTLFVKLDDTHVESRAAIAAQLRKDWALEPRLWVGTPADAEAAAAWDLYLNITATSLIELESALRDPRTIELLDWLSGRAIVTKAWNFEVL